MIITFAQARCQLQGMVYIVYIPVDGDQVLSTPQTQEYNPQDAFAPDFVPVVEGHSTAKKQTPFLSSASFSTLR